MFTYVKVATVKLRNKVPCHAVADKLLGEWSARELRASEAESLGN